MRLPCCAGGAPGLRHLNAAAREALATEWLRRRFANLGQDIPPLEMQSVQALAEFQKAEIVRCTPLLKAAGFNPD